MEKILISDSGYITVYDTEENTITYNSILYVDQNEMYASKKGGQVITSTKVIDVNPGEIVIPCKFYSNRDHKFMCEVVVITDPAASHDLNELKELIKYHKEEPKKNEAV